MPVSCTVETWLVKWQKKTELRKKAAFSWKLSLHARVWCIGRNEASPRVFEWWSCQELERESAEFPCHWCCLNTFCLHPSGETFLIKQEHPESITTFTNRISNREWLNNPVSLKQQLMPNSLYWLWGNVCKGNQTRECRCGFGVLAVHYQSDSLNTSLNVDRATSWVPVLRSGANVDVFVCIYTSNCWV